MHHIRALVHYCGKNLIARREISNFALYSRKHIQQTLHFVHDQLSSAPKISQYMSYYQPIF